MKFTVKERFQAKGRTWEVSNTHDSEVQGVPEQDVLRWRSNGWVDVEGMDPVQRKPQSVTVQPDKAVHAQKAKEE